MKLEDKTIEPNMYVRTKCGIEQIYRIDNNKTKWKYVYKLKEQDGDGCINIGILSSEDILKASHNIIDLIEVGDYVNGYKIERVDEPCQLNPYGSVKFRIDGNYDYEEILGNEIKTIVTKEQMEAIQYKVV